MKRPDQVIDEVTNVIYPPVEAILPQLYSIKTIAASAGRVYEATEDIHSIFPNLDAMQKIINYLRGAPIPEDLKPMPEDTLKPIFTPASSGFNIVSTLNRNGEYDISIVGIDVDPAIAHPELFGNILNDLEVVEMQFEIPVTCGKRYLIAQENPVLEYYANNGDTDIMYDEKYNVWVKEKQYMMNEDTFQYAFLLEEGRSKVRIAIYADYEEPIVFNITSHIHFKKKEVIPPDEGDNNG